MKSGPAIPIDKVLPVHFTDKCARSDTVNESENFLWFVNRRLKIGLATKVLRSWNYSVHYPVLHKRFFSVSRVYHAFIARFASAHGTTRHERNVQQRRSRV